jgi:hypothetical protein
LPEQVISIGLLCHPAVRWLIATERVVNDYIRDFIADRSPSDTFDVAGPPSLGDMKRLKEDPEANIELPCVTLKLKKDKHHDAPVIRVSASEQDLAMVQAWMLRAQSGPLPSIQN